MSKWIILHNNSKFSTVLSQVLKKEVLSIHIDELVNQVAISAHMDKTVSHQWSIGGTTVDDFYQRIIFQEVFFDVDSALYDFDEQDRAYVKFSWQAYLLGLFSYSKVVINPVQPNNLSISYYQFPRLLSIADKVGFSIPRYEIGTKVKPGYVSLNTLWYWPDRENNIGGILNVEKISGQEVYARFVRYDCGYIVCWPTLPTEIRDKLLLMCNQLNVYIGEVYFVVNHEWHFYSLRPQIKSETCSDDLLVEIAACLRDIGNEEIV